MNDLTQECRAELVSDVAALKAEYEAKIRAHGERRYAELCDRAEGRRIGDTIKFPCGCTATLKDQSDPWSTYINWVYDETDCREIACFI